MTAGSDNASQNGSGDLRAADAMQEVQVDGDRPVASDDDDQEFGVVLPFRAADSDPHLPATSATTVDGGPTPADPNAGPAGNPSGGNPSGGNPSGGNPSGGNAPGGNGVAGTIGY